MDPPQLFINDTRTTKLTHEDLRRLSVLVPLIDELRVVLAVKPSVKRARQVASGIPVAKDLCKLRLPALPEIQVPRTGVSTPTLQTTRLAY